MIVTMIWINIRQYLKRIHLDIEGGNVIKFFYLVTFEYLAPNGNKSSFDLGVFSKKKIAQEKVAKSACLPGFNQYSIENFEITKFGVQFDDDVKEKNVILYCVTHEYDCADGETYWNIFDYFSTSEKAENYVEYLKKHSRIGKKYPDNFAVIDIRVNNFNSWSEGFVKLDEIEI
jgi:hypothetical protein